VEPALDKALPAEEVETGSWAKPEAISRRLPLLLPLSGAPATTVSTGSLLSQAEEEVEEEVQELV